MGSSVKRSKKSWTARWRDVDGVGQWKSGFKTKKEADNYWKDQEALVRKGRRTNVADLNMTLYDYVLYKWKLTLDVRPATKTDYQRALRSHILPVFGDTAMSTIKPEDIKAFGVMLKNEKDLAPRTTEKILNLLAQILRAAVINEYLFRSPFEQIKRGTAEKLNEVQPLSFSEIQSIVDNLAPQYQIMVWIGYWTGMRPSELLGLTFEQLDFENGTIEIDRQLSRDTSIIHEPKGLKTKASRRTIGFPTILQEQIKQHIKVYGLGPSGLILQNRLGGVLRYPDANRLFRNASIGIGGLKSGQGMHQLRHACVSTLANIGVSPKDIQVWVGHKGISETMDVYGHLFPDAKNKVAARLDAFAFENNPQAQNIQKLVSINT
jgi:integrase